MTHSHAHVENSAPVPPSPGAPVHTAPMGDPAQPCCDRRFHAAVDGDAPPGADREAGAQKRSSRTAVDPDARLAALRADVVGGRASVHTPFGPRLLCYADWSASGRGLHSVETVVLQSVLPLYSNSHSTGSGTGLQSTCFLAEARTSVAASVKARCQYGGARDGCDVVLFEGAGATACCAKLVQLLGLHMPWPVAEGEARRPVVLVGPYEHHSTLLAWRESCARVVELPEACTGTGVCRSALARELAAGMQACLVIGCFSVASNVTGVTENTASLAATLHAAGALACFDFAGASGGMEVCMNPGPPGDGATAADVAADAIFMSPHKLPGGPGSPGILVVKRALLRRSVPSMPGGGTVQFVSPAGHSYVRTPEDKEQGGTQDVLAACRASLALRVRASFDAGWVAKRAHNLARLLDTGLRRHPRVKVLGPPVGDTDTQLRLPVCSFLVRGPGNRWLHHHFVTALLNDVFGIQCRGGCACAGPYGLHLLGATSAADVIEAALRKRGGGSNTTWGEALRPGWTRLSFSFCTAEEEVDYVLTACHAVANHGWRLLPQYRVDCGSGEWRHCTRSGGRMPHRAWLAHAPLPWEMEAAGVSQHQAGDDVSPEAAETWAQQLQAAEIFTAAATHADVAALSSTSASTDDALRWFALPQEAAAQLRREKAGGGGTGGVDGGAMDDTAWVPLGPIQPVMYPLAEGDDVAVDPRQASVSPISEWRDGATCEPQHADPASLGALRPVTPASVAGAMQAQGASSDTDASDEEDGEGWALASAPPAPAFPHAVVPAAPGKVVRPPRKLLATVARSVAQFGMIQPGDNILIGLSGGKDSLTLLHTLLTMRAKSPVPFSLGVATVDPGADGFDPTPLGPYVTALGLPYHFLANHIMEDASQGSMQGDSICAFCARMKRGALYSCAAKHGYTALALGQHADDVAESLLLSAFHNGALRTMKACYTSASHGVRVIRPLIAVRESATRDFAYGAGLPVIADNCPACFETPKQRRRVKQLLRREEAIFPHAVANLSAALVPLLDPRTQAVLRAVRDELDGKRKSNTAAGQRAAAAAAAAAGGGTGDVTRFADVTDDALLEELLRRGGAGVTVAQVAAAMGAEEAAEEAEAPTQQCALTCPPATSA